MHKEIVNLLTKHKIPISANYLKLRLESHPDYPSLIAAKDTLEELGILTNVYQADKEHLQEVKNAFLIHLNLNGGVLLCVNSLAYAEKSVSDLEEKWTGIVLLIDSWKPSENEEHKLFMKSEKRSRLGASLSAILVLASLLFLSLYYRTSYSFLWLLSSSAGLYLSWLIIHKEMGIRNTIGDKICSFAARSRCESVLFSRGARLFDWLSWGDIGIIYFCSSIVFQLLCLLWQPLSAGGWMFYSYLSIAAVSFSGYSLFYQAKVIRQWCMLCIGVLAALAINATVAVVILFNRNSSANIVPVTAIFVLLLIIHFEMWQPVKSMMQKAAQFLGIQISQLKFKRDPAILKGLMSGIEGQASNLPQEHEAIRFGNANAPIQIVMACNPYCGPCAQAHTAIEELFEQYPDKIAFNIRFALSSIDEANPKMIAASAIIRSVKENKENAIEVMKDWYALMNHDDFLQKYNPKNSFVMDVLKDHQDWGNQAMITATPTLFINGKMLHKHFNWKEFTEIMKFDLQR